MIKYLEDRKDRVETQALEKYSYEDLKSQYMKVVKMEKKELK